MIKTTCDSCQKELTRAITLTTPATDHGFDMWAYDERTWHFCNFKCAYEYLRDHLIAYGVVK